MLEVALLSALIVPYLVVTFMSFRPVSPKRERPRPWWEAPPFPLDNADRIYNYQVRRAGSGRDGGLPPRIPIAERWERVSNSGLREDEQPEQVEDGL